MLHQQGCRKIISTCMRSRWLALGCLLHWTLCVTKPDLGASAPLCQCAAVCPLCCRWRACCMHASVIKIAAPAATCINMPVHCMNRYSNCVRLIGHSLGFSMAAAGINHLNKQQCTWPITGIILSFNRSMISLYM